MVAVANLVWETSISTGTGNLSISAVAKRFSDAFGTGGTDAFPYFIVNRAAAEWEYGTGHMSDASTLVRDTVIESSNSNSAVNFSAGVKDITNSVPASSIVQTSGAQTLSDKSIQSYGEPATAIGSIGGGTQDIDLSATNVFSATVDTSETTFTFSNPKPSGTATSFTLVLVNGGSQTVNWPASVRWSGGEEPPLTTSGQDVITFMTVDAGTNWYGFVAGLDMSVPT